MEFVQPVGLVKVRQDRWGNGRFGMPRGTSPDGSKKYHDGLDLEVEPGDPIFSPINGKIDKVDYPYASDLFWTGLQISNNMVRVEVWYMNPFITAGRVNAGQQIGVAQDISKRYPPTEDFNYIMKPHIHLRVTLLPFTVLADGRYVSFEQHVDPELFLGV
jgi:hypothetical protein